MCCCARFIIKYMLLIANLVFFLLGTGLLVLGILGLSVLGEIIEVLSFIQAIPVLLTSIGAIVMVISFFGCCGAAKQNKCMLYFYSGFMLLLVGLKIWLATEIFRNLNNIQESVKNILNNLFRETPQAFSVFELFFQCCGTTGHEVYPIDNIPQTCCAESVCTPLNSFDGCNTTVADYFDSFGAIIGSAVIVAICIEVVALVFAIFIANFPKKSDGRVVY